MTASLQTKKGRPNYYVVLSYKDEDTQKNKTKWLSTDIPIRGNNKKLANDRLEEILAEYKSQKVDLSNDILFDVYIENWLEGMRHSIEVTTYGAYQRNVKQRIVPFFRPLKLRVRDVTPAHIQQFVEYYLKMVSANTVRRYLANISKCLNSAMKQNIIAFNPVHRIYLPKKIKFTGAKFYNEQQIDELLDKSLGDPLEIVILLTVFYGLRRSEVDGLRWRAIDFANDTITIEHTIVPGTKVLHMKDSTKNDSSYAALPLVDVIKERLLKWRAQQKANKQLQPNDYVESDYVCTQLNGALIKPDFISQHFQILLKRIGMPTIRFHDLRHSSANYLKYLGFDLKDIQVWLRHKDIQTTMNIYVSMDMAAKRGIADGLNEKFAGFKRI